MLYEKAKSETPSEMALIRKLHWWTVEYGLIGTLEDYKIYGAGLLSSIGESKWCLTDHVKKLPYTIDAAWQDYDITEPQPQLYVTPNFAHLSTVLEEFANGMALRTGGRVGVEKLINSKSLGTIELSTGLQISGIFDRVIANPNGETAYIQTTGSTALAYREKELIGHGSTTYPQGFGSPLGKLKGINLAIEDMSPRDLEAYNIYEEREVRLEFEGGIIVSGEVITGKRNLKGKIMLVTFKNCLVQYKDKILFQPDWGLFHMAVGKEVVSAFAGPADFNSFDLITHTLSKLEKTAPNSAQRKREKLYQQVREIRNNASKGATIISIFEQVKEDFPKEWLLLLELYEQAYERKKWELAESILLELKRIQETNKDVSHLIADGVNLIHETTKRETVIS